MRLSDVMTRGVECIPPDDNIAHAAERMKELDVGRCPCATLTAWSEW
jgi:CBS domain-containing protein